MVDIAGSEGDCSDTIRGSLAGAWSDQNLLDWLHESTKQLDAKFSRTDAAISELAAASADLEARVQNAVARLHILSQSNFIEHVPPPPPHIPPGFPLTFNQSAAPSTACAFCKRPAW